MSKKTKAKSKKASLVSIAFSLSIMIIVTAVSFLNISLFPPKIDIQEINEAKASGESWYSTGGTWNYRKKITIDHTKVVDVDNPSTTYANFPILISTTGLSNIKENGSDIRFTMADGITEIPREIETYNSGNLEAWVKLTLTKDAGDSTNDEIYIYYGNSSATEPLANSEFGSENVWNGTGAIGVWHMAEDSGLMAYDSTGNNNNFTNEATVEWEDGGLKFDGMNKSSQSFESIQTLIGSTNEYSAIIKYKIISRPAFTNYQANANNAPFSFKRSGNVIQTTYRQDVVTYTLDSGVSVVNGEVATVEFTAKDGDQKMFVDGLLKASAAEIGAPYYGFGSDIVSMGSSMDGIIYYFLIYNKILSSEEIKTQYNNQSSSTFLTFGNETTPSNCTDIGGDCKINNCSTYIDCSLLLGACGTGNCCIGSCVLDTEDPTIPINLSAVAISESQINLTWTASTDNVGVKGYNIYRDTNLIDTSLTNSYSDTDLFPTTLYTYTVSAYDGATTPNESSRSNSMQAITSEISVINTLTYPINDTGDDARFTMDFGYDNNLSSEYLDYSIRDPYMRFQVDIPKNTTITSAVIKLVPAGQKNTVNSDIKINLIDFDSCPTFTGADRYANTNTYIDYSINSTTWNSKLNNTENPYEITGLQSLVQAYVDRGGYDYNQYIGLHFAQSGDADYKLFYSSNKGLDYYPEFIITYTGGDTVLSEVYMAEPYVRIKQKLYCQLVNTKKGDKLVVTVDGVEQVNRTLSSYTKGEEVVTVDYTGLTAGNHSLIVQIKNSADISYPSSFTKNWTTLHNGIPKVGINENNAICLEGTPFFPVTNFIAHPSRVETKFNGIYSAINGSVGEWFYTNHTISTFQDYLNKCNDRGNFYAAGPLSRWDGFDLELPANSDLNKLASYVQECKNYPALLAWAWDDEPNLGGVGKAVKVTMCKQWCDLCYKNDTNHPVTPH